MGIAHAPPPEHKAVKLLYIAGYGRSGSSILSRLLAQQSRVLSLGEYGRASEHFAEGRQCSCGVRLDKCEFWGPLSAPDDHKTRDLPGRMLDRLGQDGAYDWAIDSSKTAYRDFLRPLKYLVQGRELRLIQLVRDPEHVLASARKGRNKDLEAGAARMRRFETARTIAGWLFANAFGAGYRLVMGRHALRISYEDLLSEPFATLDAIQTRLGVPVDDVRRVLAENRELDAGHEIAGNRTLREGSTVFRTAERRPEPGKGSWWRLLALVSRPLGG